MQLARITMLAALGLATAQASGFTGVYGMISKVDFEPTIQHPQRVRVYGIFSVGASAGTYLPAQRGYLYFTVEGLPASAQQSAIDEWMDLKAVAGTGTVIAFSERGFGSTFPSRVWKADEKASAPEQYRSGVEAKKMQPDSTYEPVRSIIELSKKPQS